MKQSYTKEEIRIEMRDGVTLHTTIYRPSDGVDQKFPILLNRTPYGCNPYGEPMPDAIMHNEKMLQSGYIFVFQDLRSRSMSDGTPEFENLKPAYSLHEPAAIDEITDAEDTINWLLENVPGHNDRVGVWGHSYTATTALLAAAGGHPKVKAVLTAAPSVDFYFEDFGRNGLFTLAYMPILDWFGTPKNGRHMGPWWENNLSYWADGKRFGLAYDTYDFFLKKGSLKNFDDLVTEGNYFWEFLRQHPNYDQQRRDRNMLNYIEGVQCPVLVVGGWNDEQNLYGIVRVFETLTEQSKNPNCYWVVGPWSHGQYNASEKDCFVGDVFYGEGLSSEYQESIEFQWWEKHLKPDANANIEGTQLPKIRVFDTGSKQWHSLSQWPPVPRKMREFYLNRKDQLVAENPSESFALAYISDPNKPVPYLDSDQFQLFPAKQAMTADQRFASKRPDVLTFVSPPLEQALTVCGSSQAKLKFVTDRTDADLFVKLIDVYPMDRPVADRDPPSQKMNGYQQLVRFGCIRTRFRNDYARPEPLLPDQVSEVTVSLLDVCHTFEAKHRVMIQIQSSMFPLFDRNPQNYVENIFFAEDSDFEPSTHQILSGSYFEFSTIHFDPK